MISAAYEEGKKIGRANIRMEDKIELARKARKMGLSVEDIAWLTCLSAEETLPTRQIRKY